MVSFRKTFLLLAVVALAAGIASAQNFVTCTANSGVVPLLRAEGTAEEVGQITIECRGGIPTPAAQPIPQFNVTAFLDVNVTSRLLNTAGYSEAVLLIDEPGAPTNLVPQVLCPAPGNCIVNSASGSGGSDSYNGSSSARPNVFQGIYGSPNVVSWLGVPLDAPGTANVRTLRIANIRVNASQAASNSLIPPALNMRISITGTGGYILVNPVQIVGYVQKGLTLDNPKAIDLKQCDKDSPVFTVPVKEGFANAFRARPASIALNPQNVPGKPYNTESMFTGPFLPGAGVATQATRLRVAFGNIPTGIGLSVPNVVLSGASATPDKWCIVTGSDANGVGGGPDCTVGNTTVLTTTASTRSAAVIYELTGETSNIGEINTVNIPVTISRSSSPLPSLGTGSWSVSFAPLVPLSTTGATFASATLPTPRFIDPDTNPQVGFTVSACRTNLLWPYVTAAAGFDTGMAISNTSLDIYATPTQTGSCRVSYFGSGFSGTLPSRRSIGVVEPGKYVAWLVSTGGLGDLTGTPGFTGYVIAQCDFQFAHGYAFITNPGETRWAQGYLALVLDQDMYGGGATRTGDKSETLKH